MKQRGKNGKFKKSAVWVNKTCENCGVVFQVKESDLKYGRGKCCSRKCVDENKKETYKGESNPSFGRVHSEEEIKRRSESMKKKWNDVDFQKRMKMSQDEFFERASKDGTWDRANEKREQTWLKKIGKRSNLVGEYGNRECDKTFIKKYGMSSHEYRNTILHNNRTSIELVTEFILNENNIENIPEYNIDGYCFDFYLPNEIILIECDGDYWHGFDRVDEELDDNQKRSRDNDVVKNKVANNSNIRLLRFWEHEIHKDNYETILLNSIYGKENTSKKD